LHAFESLEIFREKKKFRKKAWDKKSDINLKVTHTMRSELG
jgi:hypothetical protein